MSRKDARYLDVVEAIVGAGNVKRQPPLRIDCVCVCVCYMHVRMCGGTYIWYLCLCMHDLGFGVPMPVHVSLTVSLPRMHKPSNTRHKDSLTKTEQLEYYTNDQVHTYLKIHAHDQTLTYPPTHSPTLSLTSFDAGAVPQQQLH